MTDAIVSNRQLGKPRLKRASTPGQQQIRRKEILDAAYVLFRNADFREISLNAIAQKARLSKTSLYLYFRTREEIFLHIFNDAFREWISSAIYEINKLPGSASTKDIAVCLIRVIWNSERMRSLAPLLQLSIEHNVSEDMLAGNVRMKLQESKKLQLALQGFFPGISHRETFELVLYTFNLFNQFVANATNQRLVNVLKREEFAMLNVDLYCLVLQGVERLFDFYVRKR